ncbi:MAG: EamA family transporter [Candidatus Methanomethylophilaceae archaeon]|nr:EamA family transporter [Candidatus Methanomethylophilaceae archaeon]
MDGKDRLAGVVAAISAGVIWGFLGPVIRFLGDGGIDAVQMTCLRYLIVTVMVGILISFRSKGTFKIDFRVFILFAVMGVVGTFLNSACYFGSMQLIPLSLSTILQYLAPFIVVTLSVPLFRERLTVNKAVAVVVAFVGCVLCTGILSSDVSFDPVGIAMGALSGLFFATYTLGSKHAANLGHTPETVLFFTSLICFAVAAPFADLPTAFSALWSSVETTVVLLALGVLLTFLPFWLFNYSLDRLDVGKTSILTFVEPMTATAVGFAIYSETLDATASIGIAMILVALIVLNRRSSEA